MDLSFQEKSIIGSRLTTILLFGWYCLLFFKHLQVIPWNLHQHFHSS